MSFDAPFTAGEMTVQSDWIDYNGHLNMAYYNVLFDRCVDEAFAALGLGPDYVKEHDASFYTLEVHLNYLRELHEADPVRVTLQLLDFDAKRTHFFQEMYHARDGFLAATSEQMSMHVDLGLKKSSPFPDDVLSRIRTMHRDHAGLEVPPQVGRVISIPRKPATA